MPLEFHSSGQSTVGAAYNFTTFAGLAAAGSTDGVGTVARFNLPEGLAIGRSGNIYVSDTLNHTIRKISSAGIVSTIAGVPGNPGSQDGTNNRARFNYPRGIAVDSAENLYVAERLNRTIRKLTPEGTNWVVTTIAGLAVNADPVDGFGSAARFGSPSGVALDEQGNLYVTEADSHVVRLVSPVNAGWSVTTIAGMANHPGSADGAGTNALFNSPYGVAVDVLGNVFVADGGNHTIRRIASVNGSWVVSTIAGLAGHPGVDDGTDDAARFEVPSAVTVFGVGNLYVFDSSSFRKLTAAGPNWQVTTLAGGSGGNADGTGAEAQFASPLAAATDRSGRIYVADSFNNLIRKVTSAGVVTTFAGITAGAGSANGTAPAARFRTPHGLAVDSSGTLYVADTGNRTIRQISSAGSVTTIAGSVTNSGSSDGVGGQARFGFPVGIAVDSDGDLYVSDNQNSTIRRVSAAGVVTTIAGEPGRLGNADGTNNGALFAAPYGMAVDKFGTIYVTDSSPNNSIRKLRRSATNWVVSTIAGLSGTFGGEDGVGGAARFSGPTGLAVDDEGSLYVADTGNNTIRKITPIGDDWVVTTIAGKAQETGSIDGLGSEARFRVPLSVAVDNAHNVYVADFANQTIRKITPTGAGWLVTTIGGFVGLQSSEDGTGSEAHFFGPAGIAVDKSGNLYVSDDRNHTIRKGVFIAYVGANPTPYQAPPLGSRLVVELSPAQAGGQWRFPWEFGWRDSGTAADNLGSTNYTIEFRNVPGYVVLPVQPVQLSNGETTTVRVEYLPTLGPGDANNASGTLTVYLGPTPPEGAGWRFLGGTGPFFPTGFTTNLLPGTYLIEFAAAQGRIKPPSQSVQINPGLPSSISVNYLLAAGPPEGVYLPFPVPANQIMDESNYPFGFNGQLQTDTGYGSGVAVQTNVVLTAAHLVFDDQSLSFVSRAHWFFRRDAGANEPPPQGARGFYLLSGYAAQRTNDLQSGYSPEQSTPPSRNADVAALYFLSTVAGGGHGGYLPSDEVPNPWLSSTALKMLVGYPVDGSQFGNATIVSGKMYQTEPQPFPLTAATDSVPGQPQVYTAPWFLSYPGNSGGPLYAQLNGYYYPAAVYIGTLFSGSQPYASIVRAIDGQVANLITMAAVQGDNGTNNTGGGVIVPGRNTGASGLGYVQFQLAPPAAVVAGAAWRLRGEMTYSSATNFTRVVPFSNALNIEFKPIPGWLTPADQTVGAQSAPLTPYTAFYTVMSPKMLIDPVRRLGITGTTGTVYRLESKTSLSDPDWIAMSTNAILTSGFNLVLPELPPNVANRFYRLKWLP